MNEYPYVDQITEQREFDISNRRIQDVALEEQERLLKLKIASNFSYAFKVSQVNASLKLTWDEKIKYLLTLFKAPK